MDLPEITVLSASLILTPSAVLRILLFSKLFSPGRPSAVCSGASDPMYVKMPSEETGQGVKKVLL